MESDDRYRSRIIDILLFDAVLVLRDSAGAVLVVGDPVPGI